MPLNTLLQTLAADITTAECCTEEYSKAVRTALRAGETDATAEQALYAELDRLMLLRDRQYALSAMRGVPVAA